MAPILYNAALLPLAWQLATIPDTFLLVYAFDVTVWSTYVFGPPVSRSSSHLVQGLPLVYAHRLDSICREGCLVHHQSMSPTLSRADTPPFVPTWPSLQCCLVAPWTPPDLGPHGCATPPEGFHYASRGVLLSHALHFGSLDSSA